MSNQPALVDKVALVLGGSRGIGAAIAIRLAADGAMVALTYANSAEKAAETARAAEAHGQPVITIKADSADPKAVVDAVAQTIARFGHLDIASPFRRHRSVRPPDGDNLGKSGPHLADARSRPKHPTSGSSRSASAFALKQPVIISVERY